jgi:hypothetical protein
MGKELIGYEGFEKMKDGAEIKKKSVLNLHRFGALSLDRGIRGQLVFLQSKPVPHEEVR